MVGRRWREFLRDAPAAAHGVQVYEDVGDLARSVATFLGDGFDSDEPGVLVATPAHSGAILDLLDDTERLLEEGRLVIADADATLAAFSEAGTPSAAGFERIVGGLLDGAAGAGRGRRVRVFGEMVDLLVQRSQPKLAAALEELWNALMRARGDFVLLCGYRLDVFDRNVQARAMPDVCRAHSHVQPADDAARFAQAVDRALAEVLGDADAGKVYVCVASDAEKGRVPVAELALMWVSEHMPAAADRILASARARYRGDPLIPVTA